MGEARNSKFEGLRRWFVSKVYATHNESKWVKQALSEVLGALGPGKRGLNIGCGSTRLHGQVLNVDITRTTTVDCVADAQQLPFRSEAFDLVVTQETLEHVANPFQALCEMSRVLRKGGILYCQVPFVIGYHPGPTDFYRFTRQGVRQLVEQAGLHCVRIGIAVGPGTALYRVLVEFVASTVARVVPVMYMPVKALCAVILFPLKWLDSFLITGPQADRVAGGYFVIARKE